MLLSLLGTVALSVSVNAIPQITRSGRYLYDASGNRFSIKGVGYQPQGSGSVGAFGEPTGFIDPLSSGTNCTRDIPYLKQLGVNTVRVYSVNSSLNHDDCMQALSGANIYTIIDLALPQSSISRDTPAWSTDLLTTYLDTVSVFSKYDNVLAYNVGNEVTLQNGTASAAFVKAAARDTKAYLNSINSKALVGYASIDGASNWVDPLATYLTCDPSNQNSGNSAIDLFGSNNYRWCGNSTFEQSYAGSHGDFAGLDVAVYFSEFGCVPSTGVRTWEEVGSLFSSQMSDVFSGGIAFNYFPATSAQGTFTMVTISDDGNSVQTSADFTNLVTAYKAVNMSNTPSQSNAPAASYPSCPTANSTFLASSSLPPTPNQSACSCLEKASPCQFKPPSNNPTVVAADVGVLLDYTCSLLGQNQLSCADINANGSSGMYGNASSCDPETKLSYVFSIWYQNQKQSPAACDFAGNGTVNTGGSGTFPSGSASKCVANASGVSVPTLASTPGSTQTKSTTPTHTSGNSGSGSSGSAVAFTSSTALVGVAFMAVMSLFGGLVVL